MAVTPSPLCLAVIFLSVFGSLSSQQLEENFNRETEPEAIPELTPFRLQSGLKRCPSNYCCPKDTKCCRDGSVGFITDMAFCCKNKRAYIAWSC